MARARKRRTLTRQGESEEEIAEELAAMQEEESDEDEEISGSEGEENGQFYGIGEDGKMGPPAPPPAPPPPIASDPSSPRAAADLHGGPRAAPTAALPPASCHLGR